MTNRRRAQFELALTIGSLAVAGLCAFVTLAGSWWVTKTVGFVFTVLALGLAYESRQRWRDARREV